MTIDDIANYCEFKDCMVSLGDVEVGFIHIDGNGLVRKSNNFRRFLQFNELSALAAPGEVLSHASVFRIQGPRGERQLTREAFEEELREFQEKVDL